jgi:hypothetical protein
LAKRAFRRILVVRKGALRQSANVSIHLMMTAFHRQFFVLTIALLAFLTACKNYYNDTIEWADNIKVGTDIQAVKNSQPDFLEIAWDKPDKLENELFYEITEIKGGHDHLNMQHFLIFIDNKYQGRRPHK